MAYSAWRLIFRRFGIVGGVLLRVMITRRSVSQTATSIRKEAQHETYVGMDVSLKETSLCIV